MTLYLSGTVAYGLFLLLSKFSDRECSKTDLISWLVIAIASGFWIVVIPISLLEIISKSKAKLKQSEQIEAKTADDISGFKTSVSIL